MEYASRQLNSIEINGSFYSLHRVESWKKWHEQTPEDFVFSVKGVRFITHIRRLNSVEQPLANFFAQGLLALGEKLGPILWQFPPNMKWDAERFGAFFDMLPRDTESAAKLARRHDERLKGRSWTRVTQDRPLRYAIEVRHESFKTPDFIKLLRKHSIALVVADTAGKWPYMEDLTSDFIYARLHGEEELYVSGYTTEALDRWAARVKAWRSGKEVADAVHISNVAPAPRKQRDIFVYFDNDVKVRAPYDAISLAQRIGGFVPAEAATLSTTPITARARRNWPGLSGKKS